MLNKRFDVDGHLKVSLKDLDEDLGINFAHATLVATHGHEGVHGLLLVEELLIRLPFRDDSSKLTQSDVPVVLKVSPVYHSLEVTVADLVMSHGLEDYAHFPRINMPRAIAIENCENFSALFLLIRRQINLARVHILLLLS